MKKLFTLALVLLVATAGYSQMRTMSRADVSKNSASKKATKGMEVFENVQSLSNMTRSDGELDYTFYDWQSNAGAITRTIVWPDGTVNFAFSQASDDTYADRGTCIGTYDYQNDRWIPLGGRIESEKTGFGSIARYQNNGIVVAAHTSTDLGVYIVKDKNSMSPNSVNATIYTGTDAYTHPSVMTSGPNRDIIHVVAAKFQSEEGGVAEAIRYWRTSNNGQSWDKACVELPFLSADYGTDHGTNTYYFMETTEDNCLGLVINTGNTDGIVLYSYDNGETWEKKTYFVDPALGVPLENSFAYPRWTSAQWTANKNLMMAYEYNFSDHQGHYGPALGGVAFWSDYMPYRGTEALACDPRNPMPPTPGQPFIMDSAYIYNDIYSTTWFWSDASHDMWPEYMGYLSPLDPATGQPLENPYEATTFNLNSDNFGNHGSYNNGVCGMPVLCKVNNSDMDLVAVWIAMDEHNTDGTNFYFKLFASYSGDGGLTWQRQKQLTTDFIYELSECVYPQAAVVGTTLIVATQMDGGTGTFVMEADIDGSDCYYQGMTFELSELFSSVNVQDIVSHNTHMTVYPNPATDLLNINLSQNSDIVIYNVMGQQMLKMEGRVGGNNINISNLNSGVYFINAGSDTQKFIVK